MGPGQLPALAGISQAGGGDVGAQGSWQLQALAARSGKWCPQPGS